MPYMFTKPPCSLPAPKKEGQMEKETKGTEGRDVLLMSQFLNLQKTGHIKAAQVVREIAREEGFVIASKSAE